MEKGKEKRCGSDSSWQPVSNCRRFSPLLKPFALAALATSLVLFGCGSPRIAAVSVDNPKDQLTSETIKGKVALIDFWATWCGPCRETMPDVQSIYDAYKDKGLLVCGITTDEPQTVKQFLSENHYTYPMYSDIGEVTSSAFNVEAIPHLVLFDKRGRVVDTEEGAPLDVKKLREAIESALSE